MSKIDYPCQEWIFHVKNKFPMSKNTFKTYKQIDNAENVKTIKTLNLHQKHIYYKNIKC